MVAFMKESTKMIRKKDLEFLNGLMEGVTKDIGKMVNSMEKEHM